MQNCMTQNGTSLSASIQVFRTYSLFISTIDHGNHRFVREYAYTRRMYVNCNLFDVTVSDIEEFKKKRFASKMVCLQLDKMH